MQNVLDLQLLTWLHSTKDRGQGASYDRLWRNTCNAKDTGRKRKSRIWQNNVVVNLKNFSLVLQQVKTTKLTCKFRKYTIVNKSNVYRIDPLTTYKDQVNVQTAETMTENPLIITQVEYFKVLENFNPKFFMILNVLYEHCCHTWGWCRPIF